MLRPMRESRPVVHPYGAATRHAPREEQVARLVNVRVFVLVVPVEATSLAFDKCHLRSRRELVLRLRGEFQTTTSLDRLASERFARCPVAL
jgi:hypothetical protein